LVRTWIGTTKGDNGKTRVTFLWEPASDGRTSGEPPARVLLTAMSDAGGDPYRGRVPEGGGSAGRGTGRSEAAAPDVPKVDFETEPGTLQLSVAVEGAAGNVLERDRQEIEVPDFTGTDLVLSTPSFVRARNALEWKALVDDVEAIPTASRDFRRTDRIIVRFEAYAPGTEAADVRARLLNRGGELIHPLDVTRSEDGRPHRVDLWPAHLPPGDYVIELSATSLRDDVKQLIAFRLRS